MSPGAAIQQSPYEIGDRVFNVVIRSADRGEPLPDENRGSWYCPCADERHENLVRHLMETYDLTRVYDLGAGDLRLSAALADDYDVVAYETNELLADYAYKEHGEPDIDLRKQDYYGHWASMNHRDALFVAIGKTNKLPSEPPNGIGLQGHDSLGIVFSEAYQGDSR